LSCSCCRVLLFAILSLRSLFGGHENGTTPKTDNYQPVLRGQPAEKRVTHRLASLFGGHENGTTPKTDNHQPVLKGQPAEKGSHIVSHLSSLGNFILIMECLLNLDSEIIPPRCHRVAIRPRKVAAAALCTQVSRRNRVVKKGLFLDRVGQLDAVVSCSPTATETTVQFASLFFRLRLAGWHTRTEGTARRSVAPRRGAS